MSSIDTEDFSRLFEIYEVNGYTRRRLGRTSDGGYVVPNELLPRIHSCVTFGVSNDVSFEADLQGAVSPAEIEFTMYDHTVNRIPYDGFKNARLFRKKITTNRNDPIGVHPNDTLVGKKNVLLKFDIEGSEYEFTDQLDDSLLDNVLFVLCEVHWLGTDIEREFAFMKYMTDRFTLFHLHGNNHQNKFARIYEKNVPHVSELTLINKNLVRTCTRSELEFPLPNVDYPNSLFVKDLPLNWTIHKH